MQKCKLIQIANVTAGQSAPQGAQEFSSEGTPFIRAGSLIDLINGKTEDEFELVSEVVAKNHKLKLQPKDTILFAKSGMSCMKGYVYKLKKPCYVVSHLACITPNNSVFPNYLKHYFDYNRPNKLVKDESYPSISLDDIKNLEISLPSLPEQKRIADELDIACSAIAKQKKQLALFDELIKSKFNEMFGVFDCNEILRNVCKFINGDRSKNYPKGENYVISGIPFINAGDIKDGYLTNEKFNYITQESFDKLSSGKVQVGDILYCLRGSLGKHCIVNIDKGAVASSLVILRPNNKKILSEFLDVLLYSQIIENQMLIANNGSSQPNLSAESVKNYKFYLPPLPLQQQFADFVNEIEESKLKIKESLNKTETLYKALMQKYFEKGE